MEFLGYDEKQISPLMKVQSSLLKQPWDMIPYT